MQRVWLLVILLCVLTVPAVAQDEIPSGTSVLSVESVEIGPPFGAIRIDRNGGFEDCNFMGTECEYWDDESEYGGPPLNILTPPSQYIAGGTGVPETPPEGARWLRQVGKYDGYPRQFVTMFSEIALDRCNIAYPLWLSAYTRVETTREAPTGNEDYQEASIYRGDEAHPNLPKVCIVAYPQEYLWYWTEADGHDWKMERYVIHGWHDARWDNDEPRNGPFPLYFATFARSDSSGGAGAYTRFDVDGIQIHCVPFDYMAHHIFGPMALNSYTGE